VKSPVLVDTGPLVSFFLQNESTHSWVVDQFRNLDPPLWTCEPVLTEVCHLIHRRGIEPSRLLGKIRDRVLDVRFRLDEELEAVGHLLHRYRSLPMSLADACLVRMSEIHPHSSVLTLDTHFRVYRRNGRQTIPLIIPG
jgi:predicted nucleic acid-binding protein